MNEVKKGRSRFPFVFLLGLLSLSMSCAKDEETYCPPPPTIEYESVRVQFEATAGGEDLELLKTFSDPLGRSLNAELFKFYISNIYVHKGDQKTKVKNVALISLADPNNPDPTGMLKKIDLMIPHGNYDAISFGIGLDPVQNESDPNSFDPDHPLSSAQNTHWGTWSNYKFLMMEGKGDWDNDGQLTNIYGYHTGFDQCYREVKFLRNISANNDDIAESISFTFEFNYIFFGSDTLDMSLFPTWHGDTSTISTSIILSDNFREAIKLKQ